MNPPRSWWQKPSLHQPGDEAKRVTWLELFYDLVFVVVISKLAHHLGAHPDAGGLRDFVLLFVPTWWVWTSGTYYNERFESFDLSFRLFTFLQILAVAGMAATVEAGLGRTALGFALSYIFARLIIVFLWARAGQHNPQVRPVTDLFVGGFSLSIGLWAGSLFVAPELGLLLRAAGVLTELIVPLLTLSRQSRVFKAPARKLPERLGLFVIIVLGEATVGVINGLSDVRGDSPIILLQFVVGMLVGFLLWWNYFDFIGRREPASGAGRAHVLGLWSYLHLPLLLGITATGAMLRYAVSGGVGAEDSAEALATAHELLSHTAPDRAVGWLLAGGLALVYVCLAALEPTLEPEDEPLLNLRQTILMRLATAAAALALPLLGLPLVGLALGLVVLQSLNAWVGVRAWFASSNAGRTDIH